MRKIERQMLQAIVDDRSHWSKDNTRVELDEDKCCHNVYLHGHRIACYYPSMQRLHINNCGYETNTTKSRLNVLINFVLDGTKNGIYQHNWNWFLRRNGVVEDFPSNEWVAL
tara:strand:+ start:47 stop:382 length:336 start_codon:yes stop_codon:yes gene_type:complete